MFWEVTQNLLGGFGTTVEFFLLTLLFSLPLGMVICMGSMSKFMPLSVFMRIIVWIIRGSPLMIQILVIFYGPGLIFGVKGFSRPIAGLVAFVVNYACYFSEIYRGGLLSIPHGQHEAGEVLGMTKPQIFFKITLLQLIKRIMPSMGNEFITLVKDTSLIRVISVYELIWVGESYIKKGFIWPLFYTAVFYLLFNGLLTMLFGRIEKKLDYFR